MSRISETLRNARLAAGISQAALARKVGISQAFVSDIEHGRRELGERHFEKLPEPIRTTVVRAAIAELRERLQRLRSIIK